MIKLIYWRDSAGPEIDDDLDIENSFIPIEVKWSTKPNMQDARHLIKFMNEYENSHISYIICQTLRPYILGDKQDIIVLPWQELHTIFENKT
jgi:hypothetical protein